MQQPIDSTLIMSLSEQQIEDLENLLFSDNNKDEALDYFGFHGLVCASIIGPASFDLDAFKALIFGNDDLTFTQADNQLIESCIHDISASLIESLNEGEEIYLPYVEENSEDENSHYDDCLESWCTGFMEGFFYREDLWFSKGEDIAAELLLPIMALSGLFESDEFEEIRENEKLMSQFEEIMPDQLVDIFLFYHSE
jgi:uncharacterized protein